MESKMKSLHLNCLLLIIVSSLILAAACSPTATSQSPTEAPTREQPTQNEPENIDPVANPTVTTANTPEPEDPAVQVPRFEPKSPVSTFVEEDIDLLGIDCQGTQEEIAQCIMDWQHTNMVYCGTDQSIIDCSDPIRANYVLPGLYSTHDLIRTRQKDGKVYGICFDYAVTYCSIAEYYGLECRVVNSITKPSERPGAEIAITHGMSEEEYTRWLVQLEAYNIPYDYEVLRLIAEETPEHYWAEAKLNNVWTVMDGTRNTMGGSTESEYIATEDFQVTDWMASDKSQAAYDYAVRVAQGEDLRNEGYDSVTEQFMEGRETAAMSGTAEAYVGVTDVLGQSGRSASMNDFMQGLGLMPYLATCEKACDFMGADERCKEDCPEEDEILACYEDCSGLHYYLGCVYLEGDEDVGPESYEACSGVPFDMACEASCVY